VPAQFQYAAYEYMAVYLLRKIKENKMELKSTVQLGYFYIWMSEY
jgi:hypothetical protein